MPDEPPAARVTRNLQGAALAQECTAPPAGTPSGLPEPPLRLKRSSMRAASTRRDGTRPASSTGNLDHNRNAHPGISTLTGCAGAPSVDRAPSGSAELGRRTCPSSPTSTPPRRARSSSSARRPASHRTDSALRPRTRQPRWSRRRVRFNRPRTMSRPHLSRYAPLHPGWGFVPGMQPESSPMIGTLGSGSLRSLLVPRPCPPSGIAAATLV